MRHPLSNPETDWSTTNRDDVALSAIVESRIGSHPGSLTLLAGGHANLNIRVGRDLVLRVYTREGSTLGKEQALLNGPWQTFRVPRVLGSGSDFLLLEWIELRPVLDCREHGGLVGGALAEVHQRAFKLPGFLDTDLSVRAPFVSPRSYAANRIRALGAGWTDLLEPVQRALETLRSRAKTPDDAVLNHGDFKPSNLFRGPGNELVVLDWEFAFAGPALMDVGQLFRWGASGSFRRGFERAYAEGGGQLPERWPRLAEVFDLVNLLALATGGSDPARDAEIRARVEDIVS